MDMWQDLIWNFPAHVEDFHSKLEHVSHHGDRHYGLFGLSLSPQAPQAHSHAHFKTSYVKFPSHFNQLLWELVWEEKLIVVFLFYTEHIILSALNMNILLCARTPTRCFLR